MLRCKFVFASLKARRLVVLLALCIASTASGQTSAGTGSDHSKTIIISGAIGAIAGFGLGYVYVAMNCELQNRCDGTRAELTGLVAGAAVGVIIGFFIEYGERPGQRLRNLIKLPERKPLQRTALPGAPRIPYLDASWMNRAAR